MCLLLLILLVVRSTAKHLYNVYRTEEAYYFNVDGYGLHATIDNQKYLLINSPTFSRKWALPSDSHSEKARTFRKHGTFQVVVPRHKTHKLQGGEVPRGTTVQFGADHVCATFDGTTPECGNPCKQGQLLQNFIVTKDEVIVKLRSCNAQSTVSQAIFHSFDPDITIEDEVYTVPEVVGRYGWFDRYGIEQEY